MIFRKLFLALVTLCAGGFGTTTVSAQPSIIYFPTNTYYLYEGGTLNGTLLRGGNTFWTISNYAVAVDTNNYGAAPVQEPTDLNLSYTSFLTFGGATINSYAVTGLTWGQNVTSIPFSITSNERAGVQADRLALLRTEEIFYFNTTVDTNYQQYAFLWLLDNDSPVNISVAAAGVTEGQTNYFYFDRTTSNSVGPMTVNFTLGGTAANVVDYALTADSPLTIGGTSQITIRPGYSYATLIVATKNDTVVEGAETLSVQLQANAAQYTMSGTTTASMNIVDDYATVEIEATDGYAAELGPDTGKFALTRSGNLSQAITVQLVISGTATNGVDYTTLPTNVTFAAGMTQTNLTVTPIADGVIEAAKTVVLSLKTNTTYVLGLRTNAVVTITGEGANPRDSYPKGVRYIRGAGTNTSLYSMVIPMDGLTGTRRADIEGFGYTTLYHYNGASAGNQAYASNRIAFNTAIASFGASWGKPLYLGQSYALGVYQGADTADAVVINVFSRTNGAYVTNFSLLVPNFTDTNDWANFSTNGFARTAEAYGLKTVLRDAADLTWGQNQGGYLLTHTATDTATNYSYLICLAGLMNGQYAVLNSANVPNYGYFYELTFDPRPGWRSLFLDQPQFAGTPLPPDLWNKTPDELLNYGAAVTNTVSLTPSTCTNLDQSPELRRHPILDQLVSDLNRDPLALANYVFNEIDLTDAIAYRDDGQVSNESVNQGGVNRSALAVYQEGQGSPIEQCALLIYLLRQAGYPAAYVFPPDGGLKLLDTRVGQLLRTRVQGGQDDLGRLFTTNKLIAVNYPWVAAYINSQWVHLFPWLKDSEVIEGLNLEDYLPDPYKDEQLWVKDYILGKTNLLAFKTPFDDTPATIFPKWLRAQMDVSAPGVSLDDLGMHFVNRRHLYATWNDFPRPTLLTNISTAVESLTASGITNVSPRLTNVFDTISIELVSAANPQKQLLTAEMRMADLHNRKLFLTHTNVSTGQYQALLYLAPYQPAANGQGSFAASDTTLTNKQIATLNLDGTDDNLKLRLRHRRQRALTWETALDPDRGFLDLVGAREVLQERPLRKGDVAAICFNTGRVTPAMVRVHAQDLWNMEIQLSTNAAAASSIPVEVYQGSLVYLTGMSYYERVARFDGLNRRLHKVQNLSSFAMGLAKISPRRNADGTLYTGAVDPIWPNVDMFFREVVGVGNGTARLDSGRDNVAATRNYFNLSIADGSAQEHATLNIFFGQSNSVSTVKLLQLAQSKATNGQPGVVELNYFNYQSQGNVTYAGKMLKDHDPGLWATITNDFERPGSQGWVVAWVPPGPQTNASGSFAGMGALILGVDRQAALIGNNQYGGYADSFPVQTISPTTLPQWEVRSDALDNLNLTFSDPTPTLRRAAPAVTTPWDVISDQSLFSSGAFIPNPGQTQAGQVDGTLLTGATFSPGTDLGYALDLAPQGTPDNKKENGVFGILYDPVNTLTGEFYVDEADLTLPGPMPLQVRRNYGSRNLDANQLGFGWKLNYMPFLTVAPSNNLIFAAEMDGSVLAFASIGTNLWAPSLTNNPTLDNDSSDGVGSVANRFNARLAKVFTNSVNFYYLTNADGSLRVFKEMSFPLTNSTAFDRLRPYLTTWLDNRSNFYSFEYGTNTTTADYGQVRRVTSSGGNVLLFRYDVYARIVEVYSADGRRVQYDYDQQGDLVTVTRPDTSQIRYEYQWSTWVPTNNVTNTYSTHLLVKEYKPDGRLLQNDYDDQRRVTNQWATVGPDLRLVRNATFRYTNNFSLTNLTATLTGTTTVLDYTNNVTTYFYTNSLIRRIRDPFNNELTQAWYESTDTNAPAYPRSLKSVTDKRNLTTTYLYDSRGNVTNVTMKGDLKGDGDTNATAVVTALYNSDNLVTNRVDASGNTNLFFYTNRWLLARVETWPLNATSAQAITNLYSYTSVTNSTNGTVSYGLRQREIRAAYSPDAATNDWTYDSRGFVTAATRYTGTADPLVTVTNLVNARGELAEQTDAAGRKHRFAYDPAGRPQQHEVFEAGGSVPVSWDYSYYNENGEPTWSDGPRFNPEDYVWRDYDGAGRQTQEIRWRSEGKVDGSGVEAVPGDDLYATTFIAFDAFGNLTRSIDPRGTITTNTWDALGRLLKRTILETNGTTLTTESLAYNAAGDVTFHTNALGGVTEKRYTFTGKPTYQKTPDGSTNAWTYYVDGRLRREYQSNGAYWETTYDDANRRVNRKFYTASNTLLATNLVEMDQRGNVVRRVDAAGNAFTNRFDGLDRVKSTAGPVVTYDPPPGVPVIPGSIPPPVQQASTNYFDAAGVVTTNVNALGEKSITYRDALGRVTRAEVRDSANTLVRESTTVYSADHQGVTTTNGSGATAIVSATFTDNDGHNVLAVAYPAAGVREFALRQFDVTGNATYEARYAATNSVVTLFSSVASAYDGLHRVTQRTDRDSALTTFQYDALSDLTNRAMPGGLKWQASYNNAGQLLKEYNLGSGGAGARTNTYAYFTSSSAFAGKLQTRTDGRGVVCTYAYDDWLRPLTNTHTGSLAEHNLTTIWRYDVRGLVTNVTETFATTNPGPATVIGQTFDAYGQLKGQWLTLGKVVQEGAQQDWNAAGRRKSLGLGVFGYQYAWRADGLLASATGLTGGGTYTYDTAGQLLSRTVGTRATTITSRDGAGQVLGIDNTIFGSSLQTETLSYTGDGLISAHTVYNTNFNDSRSYLYADLSRRLIDERQNLDATKRWTNTFTYDAGAASGLGLLTKIGQVSGLSPTWTGGADTFSRINTETNTLTKRLAWGTNNGPASINLLLDGQPQTVTMLGTQQMAWRAMIEVGSTGAHQLKVLATHPSGKYTAYGTNWFTNNVSSQTAAVNYDAAGNVTSRTWTQGTNGPRTQTFAWDAKGRLNKVTERDSASSGYDWSAVYDPFGRRLSTTSIAITNGVTNAASPVTISQYYDPQVEFLELGVTVSSGAGVPIGCSQTVWKLYGPDLNGVYGGLNGVGGFEAIIPGPELFCPVFSDARGNILAVYDGQHGGLVWNTARPTGYGAVPGYKPLPLGHGADIVAASARLGSWADITGLTWQGWRYYDWVANHWLSADPLGHGVESDPALMTYCGGDPINHTDRTGLLGKGFLEGRKDVNSSPANSSWAFDAGYWLGGIGASADEGVHTGAKNELIGAWNAGKGTARAAWDFTGGTAVNLWEDKPTIYGAIGNKVYDLATSADARANTWNGIKTYTTETFTDTDKFSQRVGGNGIFTLLTLGAGEVAQGFRAGGATAETAEALGAAENATTLYRAVSHAEYADITASGVLRPGPNSYEFGKFFAETGEHAAQWGGRLEGAGNFRVIEAQFPSSTANQFMRWDNPILDNIGPARFGRFEQLGQPTIRLWPGSP